ncbi:MAG: TatD family hydrolase [Candidatus Daviesbacteria bacterium]|nr:TatD family hydrolase [Candidatus Daviesbacteria bacterium]
MFDTHAHLNFTSFEDILEQTIQKAKKAGVQQIVVPGSNIENSKRAVNIAQNFEGIYAAVGIHPFHVYGHFIYDKNLEPDFAELESLLQEDKVVAVGETGLDRHSYKSKKYPDYQVSNELIDLQKKVFIRQINLAIKYNKGLIIHQRNVGEELLKTLEENWLEELAGRCVFHFCEPDQGMLNFAIKNKVYIGVDGDVTYNLVKQEFVKQIPLGLLVLETDSPYVSPEPIKSEGEKINQPANLKLIAGEVAEILGIEQEKVEKVTTENAKNLFLKT